MTEWLAIAWIAGGCCGFLLREYLYRREFDANVKALKDLERETREHVETKGYWS